jgi:hypothetical protein
VFKKVTLYVVRSDRHNVIKGSAPCIDCLKVIKSLGIKKIIYSTDEGTFIEVKGSEYNTTYLTLGRRLLMSNGII